MQVISITSKTVLELSLPQNFHLIPCFDGGNGRMVTGINNTFAIMLNLVGLKPLNPPQKAALFGEGLEV